MNDPLSLDLKTAQRLCSAAVDVGMRPVDALVEQASHERRAHWALEAARGAAPDIERVIATGELAEIDRMRIAAKAGFHESTTLDIGKRLRDTLKPVWLRIGGYWYPRGGMPIDVFYQTGTAPKDLWIPPQGVEPYRGRG